MASGTLWGLGVGPGDPELLTLKAVAVLERAHLVAYPANTAGHSQARTIASRWLGHQRELAIPLGFTPDRTGAKAAYAAAANALAEVLAAGEDAAVLCEGDPLFYGSFIYLQGLLAGRFPCKVIPGVSAVFGAAAAAGRALVWGEQTLAVLPAAVGRQRLVAALENFDAVVVLKPGRHRAQVVAAILEAGRGADAVYVEQASRAAERIVTDVASLAATPGPYFALFIVPRQPGEGAGRS